ncbi:MAG: hypothetical protein CYPHOPRED_003797 [Cyphobasidiales sp. Tagirdzhanova-0007]|nr:MAG: hypothetical protein CYPHOPRED_003797 [Cyphobasidiales sp. Tagirdzhanova-0007]
MSSTAHRIARRAGEDEAAGAELKLGEFDTAGCLVVSEVKILLEKRERAADNAVYRKTIDYVTNFARFGTEDACAAVRKALQKDATLKQFEIAQLANLCPNDAEEAKALIPRQLYLFRESLVVFALNDFKMLGLLLPFLLVAHGVSALNLSLAQAYAGQTFFDDWTFNASLAASVIDNTTQGNIHYLSRDASTAAGLTFINAAGNAIIKVDNTTSGVGDLTFGRNSIKLVSNASFSLGTLFIVDAVHLPYGCSVWPSLWTLSSVTHDDNGGEIDIWEGVNNQQNAQHTLHTTTGCTQSNNTALPYSGSVISNNCDYNINGNQGCVFRDNSTTSFGASFAASGGGVFATLWDGNGVQTWFWPRANIPPDITAGTPDPDTAGAADIFAQTCSGICTDLIGDPTNYDTAYFEIASIKTYIGAPTTASITNTTTVAGTVAATTSAVSNLNSQSTLL